MRAPSRASRGRIGFNMTPMIDVAFLLIIFFIVSSHLAQQEVQLELNLPTAASGAQPEAEPGRRLVVNLLPKGQIMTAGREVNVGELERVLDFEHAHSGEDFEVRIRSDRSVPYRFVEPILLACARAGVWKVTFSVVHRD